MKVVVSSFVPLVLLLRGTDARPVKANHSPPNTRLRGADIIPTTVTRQLKARQLRNAGKGGKSEKKSTSGKSDELSKKEKSGKSGKKSKSGKSEELSKKEKRGKSGKSATGSADEATKVHIDLYYESQCPACQELITGSFSEAYQTSGFLQMAEMTYVPYGNAQEVEDDDDQEYHFDCQHGPSECRYNTIEVCALAKIPGLTQKFDFLQCIELNDDDDDVDDDAKSAAAQDYAAVTRDCAHRTHVDAAVLTTLQDCVTSPEGNALDHDMAVKTQALDPPPEYVPYLVVNGVHDETSQDAITDSLFRYVCAVYTGPHKSSECPATTMTTTTMTADQEEDNDVTDQPELLTQLKSEKSGKSEKKSKSGKSDELSKKEKSGKSGKSGKKSATGSADEARNNNADEFGVVMVWVDGNETTVELEDDALEISLLEEDAEYADDDDDATEPTDPPTSVGTSDATSEESSGVTSEETFEETSDETEEASEEPTSEESSEETSEATSNDEPTRKSYID